MGSLGNVLPPTGSLDLEGHQEAYCVALFCSKGTQPPLQAYKQDSQIQTCDTVSIALKQGMNHMVSSAVTIQGLPIERTVGTVGHPLCLPLLSQTGTWPSDPMPPHICKLETCTSPVLVEADALPARPPEGSS